MFQPQSFRMRRRHAAATKNNDGRNYICVCKTQTNQSCGVSRRHNIFSRIRCAFSGSIKTLVNYCYVYTTLILQCAQERLASCHCPRWLDFNSYESIEYLREIYFQTWRSCWLAGDCRLERAAAGEAWMATTSGQAGRNLYVRSAVGLAGLDFQLRNVKRALGGSAGSCCPCVGG